MLGRWPSKLSSYFEDAGFQQARSQSYPLPFEMYAPFMQCHLFAAEEVSLKAMKNDSADAQGPLFRKLLAEVQKECQTGVTMAESPVVVVGKKPIDSRVKSSYPGRSEDLGAGD